MGLYSRMGEMGVTRGRVEEAMEGIHRKNGERRGSAEEKHLPLQPSLEREESTEEESVTFEKIRSAAIELYIAIERFKREYEITEDKEGEINFYPVLGSEEVKKIIELINKIAGADDQEGIKRVREETDVYKKVFLNGKIIEALGALREKRIKLCALNKEMRGSGLIHLFFVARRAEKTKKEHKRGIDSIMEMAEKIDLLTSEYSLVIKGITRIIKDFMRLKGFDYFFADMKKAIKVKEEFNFLALKGENVSIDWKKFYEWCEKELLGDDEVSLLEK